MNIKRAILLGMAVWVAGVAFYSFSFYVPILEDLEHQANIILFIVVMPLVWLACFYYYKSDTKTHGYFIGQTMLLTAVVLDALITVPFIIIPNGGSYYGFFTALGFWIIAVEFLAIASLYWYTRVYPKTLSSKK